MPVPGRPVNGRGGGPGMVQAEPCVSGLRLRPAQAFLLPWQRLLGRTPASVLPKSGFGVEVTKALACSAPPSVWTPGDRGGPMGAAWSAAVWAPWPGAVPVGELEQAAPWGSRPSFPPAGARGPPPTGSASLVPGHPSLSPPAPLTQPKPGAFVQRLHPPWLSVLTCRTQFP